MTMTNLSMNTISIAMSTEIGGQISEVMRHGYADEP
jgi:hypothetical protein